MYGTAAQCIVPESKPLYYSLTVDLDSLVSTVVKAYSSGHHGSKELLYSRYAIVNRKVAERI
jgi:hypothetical protein